MLQFADSFTCALNSAKSAVVIKFAQQEPIMTGNGENIENIELIQHDIASIVMPYDCALEFVDAMAGLAKSIKDENNND